ncbi:MAG: plastocyanin [bacterium]|nr:plastocyanin [bacterium]
MAKPRTSQGSRRLPVAAFVGGVVFCVLACGSSEEPTVAVQDPVSARVDMYDNTFYPRVVRIPVGESVRWVNVGRNPHNAVADDWSWSTEADYGDLTMPAESEASVEFQEAGVFPYFCTFHGAPGGIAMAGVVVVGDVEFAEAESAGPSVVSVASGITRHVPEDYPTIQAGVDAASPGDLVLVDRGIYREEVLVTTPSLVIRGVDRNEVIVDGEFLRGNGVLVLADGVAIENMTARNAVQNGFFWTGITGYRASYLTAYNNGLYGVYAFDSTDGLFEHSWASGSPDSGFYVGQCQPCKMVIRHVISENNALGYSGTNSGGDLYIVSSIWRHNIAGIGPNTLDSELLPPQRRSTIVANLVVANGNPEAPTLPLTRPVLGMGIVLAGGLENVVERNLVVGHQDHGIVVMPNQHENFWPAKDNVIRKNIIRRSGRADLALAGPSSSGNCFEANDFETSAPPGLEVFHGCRGLRLPLGWDMLPSLAVLRRVDWANSPNFESSDYKVQPVPPDQPLMPGGVSAPVRPAVDVFEGLDFDLASAELPPEADAYQGGETPDSLLPDYARASAPGLLVSLLMRWSYYLPAVSALACLALGLAGRWRFGAGILVAGLLVSGILLMIGVRSLAGV